MKKITLSCYRHSQKKNTWVVEYNSEVVAEISYHPFMAYRSHNVCYFQNCPFKPKRDTMAYETFESAYLGIVKNIVRHSDFKSVRVRL